ncbi:MAG: hypothetical protein AB7V07_08690 [Candidatus Delongbacteria bacterium]
MKNGLYVTRGVSPRAGIRQCVFPRKDKQDGGMLIAGIFIFHFCGMFPYETVPGVGHLLVGAFFMLSGLGLMESFKNKKNYLDDFIGKKTARQGRYSLPKDPHHYGVISKINKKDPYAMITKL